LGSTRTYRFNDENGGFDPKRLGPNWLQVLIEPY
jgi:hypothetical protein